MVEQVLMGRYVQFDDQVYGFIQESGWPSVGEATQRALDAKGLTRREEREMALGAELSRYREEVEVAAFKALMLERQASGLVRKEPLPSGCDDGGYDDDYFRDILDGTDPCLSLTWAAVGEGVASLSLKIAWPPSRANSLAIIPPVSSPSRYHCHIARSGTAIATVQCLGGHNDEGYLVAELLVRRDYLNNLPGTSRATLLVWKSLGGGGEWIPTDVELPFTFDSFRADMAFAVGHAALCWVDFLTGVLLCCNNVFHLIPLPPEKTTHKHGLPEEYRSMCCCIGQDGEPFLQLVSMEGDDIPMADVMLRTWILESPLSETGWRWRLKHSVRIGDLWHDPHYDDLPLMPGYPVISTRHPHNVVYLSVHDYEYNHRRKGMQATQLYVLGVDLRLGCVVSAFKAPPENGRTLSMGFFACQFPSSYLDHQVVVAAADLEEVGAAWTRVWKSLRSTAACRLGGRRIIPTPFAQLKAPPTSSSTKVGLQCAAGLS
ncbi:hypothetical protein HU200_011808 [Digitaria exilis]|uniref:DUF1618 domain-containing protein n=1 Tax=Digitaria exilis TaxID=1010633 RepID=A0A835KMG3_9POAL|nr:hypothetical protein HU200_011808 [Digitaria exilis]